MNGIDNLLYYYSTSSSTGNAQIVVVFRPGSNPDINQVNVQNKLTQATPRATTNTMAYCHFAPTTRVAAA